MKLHFPNQATDAIVMYIVTAAAVIVAVSQFVYHAWIDNDVNDKIRIFIHKLSSLIANISTAIATETE